jgi:uncharacterized Zn-finger protein
MVYKYQKNTAGHYVCPHCEETREKQNTMHYHYKTHDEKKGHTCTKCAKDFISKQALERHIESKHEKPKNVYTCKKCEFESGLKGNCQIHYIRMHCKKEVGKYLEETDDGFLCKCCDKSFKSSTSYYYHAFDCLKIEESKAYMMKAAVTTAQSPSCQ